MFLSNVIVAALSMSVASAKPVSPKVTRDDPPAPSDFPIGDKCETEWKYLNFNPDDDTDHSRLQSLHEIVCSGELKALSSRGAYSASGGSSSPDRVFDFFFDQEEDTPSKVESVLLTIAGDGSSNAGTVVNDMVVDNNDFGGSTGNSCDEGTLAYTVLDEDGDNIEKIHFCDPAYDRPTAGTDINCGDLDAFPSEKMDTLSRIVLHEMTHYSTVGPPSELEEQIVDQRNEDEEFAYGVSRASGLNDPKQDNQPGKAESNADNYAWMSQTSWISLLCSPEDQKQDGWFKYFTDGPPHY